MGVGIQGSKLVREPMQAIKEDWSVNTAYNSPISMVTHKRTQAAIVTLEQVQVEE